MMEHSVNKNLTRSRHEIWLINIWSMACQRRLAVVLDIWGNEPNYKLSSL